MYIFFFNKKAKVQFAVSVCTPMIRPKYNLFLFVIYFFVYLLIINYYN